MKKKKNTSSFVKLAVFACAAFAVIVMVQLQLTLNEKIDTYNQLKAEVGELEDKKEELQARADGDADEEYIIKTAKDRLNLRRPEEIIFYNDIFN